MASQTAELLATTSPTTADAVAGSPTVDETVLSRDSTDPGSVDSSEWVNPPSLSPSRASDFKACPLRYRYRVIDRIPEPPSVEAVRGTLVHAVLDELFDIPASERTVERAKTLLAPAWETLRAESDDLDGLFAGTGSDGGSDGGSDPDAERRWMDSASALLDRYFALEDPRRIEPAGREEHVSVEIEGGLLLRGIIDRLDVAPGGAIRVVDYKTGRAPSEAWEAKALFQLKFYALVLWRVRGVIPAVLQLLYLADEQRLTYSPTESELLALEKQILSLWKAIELAQQTGDFRANKGPLCRFCDHQQRCPEFGGTVLPFPRPLDAAAQPPVAATA
jgi:putative RecB family exonuclease